MSIKPGLLLYVVMLIAATGLLACGSDEDPTTECVTDSFTFDNTIRPLCGIDEVANHAVIENLALNGGTFTLYARTDAAGNGGGAFAFAGTTLTATYRGGGATDNTATMSDENWLIGFHQEAPAVHVVVKQAADPDELEDAVADLELEPGDWSVSGSPASESFYYRGTVDVTVDRVRVFHEEHHHE